jgi:hypothetical protein
VDVFLLQEDFLVSMQLRLQDEGLLQIFYLQMHPVLQGRLQSHGSLLSHDWQMLCKSGEVCSELPSEHLHVHFKVS